MPLTDKITAPANVYIYAFPAFLAGFLYPKHCEVNCKAVFVLAVISFCSAEKCGIWPDRLCLHGNRYSSECRDGGEKLGSLCH